MKSENDKTKEIHIRVSKKEKQEIINNSKTLHLSISDYILRCCLNQKLLNSEGFYELYREVHKIGVNINQIAAKTVTR